MAQLWHAGSPEASRTGCRRGQEEPCKRSKLARQNAAELAALPDAPGSEHITAFAESARSYGRRLPPSWDLTHHRYRETDVTMGAMACAACAGLGADVTADRRSRVLNS